MGCWCSADVSYISVIVGLGFLKVRQQIHTNCVRIGGGNFFPKWETHVHFFLSLAVLPTPHAKVPVFLGRPAVSIILRIKKKSLIYGKPRGTTLQTRTYMVIFVHPRGRRRDLFCFWFTCNHHRRGTVIVIVVLRGHEPVHYGVLVVPLLLRRAVRGLFAKAVVELLQELEALARHRAVVGAEERVDEHAGRGKPGGRGGRRRRGRRRRRRRDFGRRSHAAVVLRSQSQHLVVGCSHVMRAFYSNESAAQRNSRRAAAVRGAPEPPLHRCV